MAKSHSLSKVFRIPELANLIFEHLSATDIKSLAHIANLTLHEDQERDFISPTKDIFTRHYANAFQPFIDRGYVFMLFGRGLQKIANRISFPNSDHTRTRILLELVVCSEYSVPISMQKLAESLTNTLKYNVKMTVEPYSVGESADPYIIVKMSHRRAQYPSHTISGKRVLYVFKESMYEFLHHGQEKESVIYHMN